MKKIILTTLAAMTVATTLTGCMGQMAVSGVVTKANLTAVDNRYARAGLYMLLSPVYAFTASADLFVVNTIEFWTGTNPITGKGAVVDIKQDAILKVNDKLNGAATTAPLKVSSATIQQLDDNTLQMTAIQEDGSVVIMRGEKANDEVSFFVNDELISVASVAELEAYQVASRS